MTLATSIHIGAPVNEQLVFLKCREIIGIPAEHPFKIHDEGLGWADGEWIGSMPGGFRSALDVTHNHGQPLTPDCGEWCDDPCEYHAEQPVAYVDVRLDTTYGYHRAGTGQGCNDVHNEVVQRLGDWLDSIGVTEWSAHNEYTGEWHFRAQPYKEGE